MVKSGTLEHSVNDEQWIVNSGATDHMTGNAFFFFKKYFPSSDQRKVQVANEKVLVVAGTGTVRISPDIVLEIVLHVPNFSYNLLSICKLTAELPYLVKLLPIWLWFSGLEDGEDDWQC